MKIAILGGRSSTAGFRALGLDTFTAPTPADARDVWKRVAAEQYAVIFVTEPEYEVLADELEPYRSQVYPVITVIPAVEGGRHIGRDEIRALVERAVGMDVMFKE